MRVFLQLNSEKGEPLIGIFLLKYIFSKRRRKLVAMVNYTSVSNQKKKKLHECKPSASASLASAHLYIRKKRERSES